MVYSFTKEPLIKRLAPYIDQRYGVQNYDKDNLYPQRADETRNRSYTAKIAVEKTADFIYGKGFEDPLLAKLVVNSSRQTLNKILNIISKDKALFTGFALHVKYNPFTYKITEITPVEFMYCRLGLPDDDGNVCDIKYHINWEQDPNKSLNRSFEPQSYPIFNPDPEVVKAQIEEYGFVDYPGQILYWTPKPGVYPLCAFDPAFDDAQTQSEIGVFQLSGIQNKFSAQHIFKYPGQFENDTKKAQFKDGIAEFQGAAGNGSMLVVEDPDGNAKQLVESIQMQNTDKMHEFTSKNVKNAIRETMAVPAPILGQLPENGMFNQEQIKDSYMFFNEVTSKPRNEIAEVIQEIIQYWATPVSVTSFNIMPLQYGVTPTGSPSTSQPGQSQPGQPGASVQAVRPEINEAMSKLSGTQDAQLQRIIRQYDSGKLTYERALHKIKITFPLTEDEAKGILGPEEV